MRCNWYKTKLILPGSALLLSLLVLTGVLIIAFGAAYLTLFATKSQTASQDAWKAYAAAQAGAEYIRYESRKNSYAPTVCANSMKTGTVSTDTTFIVDCRQSNNHAQLNIRGRHSGARREINLDAADVLLTHLNYENSSTSTFIDNSFWKKTITPQGDAQSTSTTAQLGTGSTYFDGDGDYLEIGDSNDFWFDDKDFTIDFWFNTQNIASTTGLVGQWDVSSLEESFLIYLDGGVLKIKTAGGTSNFAAGTTLLDNVWHHMALVNYGNALTVYLDGVADSAAISVVGSLTDATAPLIVGAIKNGAAYGSFFQGYIDEVRITKGIARWTDTFTPPTLEHQALKYE